MEYKYLKCNIDELHADTVFCEYRKITSEGKGPLTIKSFALDKIAEVEPKLKEMVKGDIIFCATGVTSGDLATGVKDLGNEYEVNTFALHKSQKLAKKFTNIYNK